MDKGNKYTISWSKSVMGWLDMGYVSNALDDRPLCLLLRPIMVAVAARGKFGNKFRDKINSGYIDPY